MPCGPALVIVSGMQVAVYGATGYTGRLVVDELVKNGASVVLGGRNRHKLEAVAERYGEATSICAAAVDDPASLRRVFDGCQVAINCAGPFTQLGEPVVEACIDTNTHYLDSSGEQGFIKRVFERFGQRAQQHSVCVVPACGFDYAPGDCIARLAASECEPVDEMLIAYAVRGFSPSRGTLRSTIEMMRRPGLSYENSAWQSVRPRVARKRFEFPLPVGRQAMLDLPGGEIVFVPTHTRVNRVSCLLTASTVALHPALSNVVTLLGPALSCALQTPAASLLERAIDYLPEGPSQAQRESAEFTIVALARGENNRMGRGIVRGRDPYRLTAVSLCYGAKRMAEQTYDHFGVLAPSTALGAEMFLDDLIGSGLSWELDQSAGLS
jgi:short subunit dehydrogenase-like uncharacterized protein